MQVYGSADNLLATETYTGPIQDLFFGPYETLSYTAPSNLIHKIIFSSPDDPNNGGGTGMFDNLSFNSTAPVPLPGALPLFASGLAGLGWLSRRKRKSAA